MEGLDYMELAQEIVEVVTDKKGENIIVYNVSELTSFTDYMIIVSVNSSVQMNTILKELKKKINKDSYHVEGESSSGWVLIDYDGLILNIFMPDVREFYALERLWGEAEKVNLKCMK